MKLTIGELAKILNGDFIGNSDTLINLAKLKKLKTEILHLFLIQDIYLGYIKLGASVVIIDKGLEYDNTKIKNLIIVDDAYLSFNMLLNRFSKSKLSHFWFTH